jgi:pyrroloquinoline-quinone synthase
LDIEGMAVSEGMTVSKTVWDRIEESRERWNVLNHPFYVRWSKGELTIEELGRYSGQYRHAVEAIAAMSASAAEASPECADLAQHADEEAQHVRLWAGFVGAVGGSTDAEANAETTQCVDAWTADDGRLATLARLYAVESGQPEISRTKREGLASFYGISSGAGTAYFRVHETLDTEHAAQARELIEELAGRGDEDAIVAAAESAMRANWRLLDGVE